MKIQCQDHNIEFILQSNYFEIPRFQRPYSWDRDNWDEFWTDVFESKQKDYFIGSVVTYSKAQSKAIVDGQQRLTTITLILASIRNSYRLFGFEDRASGVQNFIERNNKNNEATYVLKTETSHPYFQTAIQRPHSDPLKLKLGEEESLLQSAFKYFSERIAASLLESQTGTVNESTKKSRVKTKLDLFRDTLLALKVIYVELDSEDDAYQVFETLNTRGKDLATADLLKNHLAKLLREKNSHGDSVKAKWSTMSDNIKAIGAEDVDLDMFIYHYWLAKNNFVQKRDLFKVAKESVKTKTAAKELLDELVTYSEIYRNLFEINLKKWRTDEQEIKTSLEAINKFRIRHPLPLLMTALHKYESRTLMKNELVKLLHTIESFTFVNTHLMGYRSSGGIAKMYASHAKSLASLNEPVRRRKAINEFATKLASKLPEKDEFIEKFSSLKYSDKHSSQKREIQYVFVKLFEWMFPTFSINSPDMSIEHIEPQSGSSLPDTAIASIGNLWFLRTSFNNQLGNEPAKLKLAKYKENHLPCDSTLSCAREWGNHEVEQRTNELAERFWLEISKQFGIQPIRSEAQIPDPVMAIK